MTTSASSQDGEWSHPELSWSTIETEHFYVHFHNGAKNTGKLTAKIAEDVYIPITSLYGYEPDGKIHFVIKDYDDIANGAAFYLDNKVEIWGSAMDFELRGTHNWLRNVVTHEFTHMISLGAARKVTRSVPAAYVQWFGYENEKRPDVLLGYPNRLVSYPILFTTMPPWFAEGVAQYQLPELEYDRWDSHRDMMLRTAVVEDKMLTYSEMTVFGKNSIGSERVYNQGYSFSGYIAEKNGIEALGRIANNMRSFWQFSFDRAIKKATGTSGGDLYDEWKNNLKEKYAYQLSNIQQHKTEGKLLEEDGSGNFYPRWSPDDSSVAYLTNKGGDYLTQTALVIRDQRTEKNKLIKGGVRQAFSWSSDGKKIIYSKKSDKNRYRSQVYDLYICDLDTKKEERLTYGLRAHSPSLSPDGKRVACVINGDGIQNLAVIDIETKFLKILTSHKNQEQAYTPQWSLDGNQIVFAKSAHHGRDLYVYDFPTNSATALLSGEADSRDAVYSPDGKKIYFAWNKTGIFNIYEMTLESKNVTPLTNVIGGAFMPSVNQKGELVFSTFVAEGYKIAHLENPEDLQVEHVRYLSFLKEEIKLASNDGSLDGVNLNDIKYTAYDDSKIPDYEIKPYKREFTSISILPRLLIDYGTIKLGTYLTAGDMLGKYSFIAGIAANTRADYDAFLLLGYRGLGPEIFVEGFNQVLNTKIDDISNDDRVGRVQTEELQYNLIQMDIGIRGSFTKKHHSQLGFVYSRYHSRAGFKLLDQGGIVQKSGLTYFIGKSIVFKHTYRNRPRSVDSAINPRAGREVNFSYAREFNDFILDDPENPESAFRPTEFGTFVEVYEPHNLHRFKLNWTERFALPGKAGLTFFGRGALVTSKVDSFFHSFAGGLPGVRGYSFYSMEGRHLLHGRLTYRFPLFRHLDMTFLHLYLDKVYLGVSYDYGGAFSETKNFHKKLHDSINLQLRMETYSFYGLPSRFFVNAAYGLDSFKNGDIRYGKEWRYYFGVLFDFLDD